MLTCSSYRGASFMRMPAVLGPVQTHQARKCDFASQWRWSRFLNWQLQSATFRLGAKSNCTNFPGEKCALSKSLHIHALLAERLEQAWFMPQSRTGQQGLQLLYGIASFTTRNKGQGSKATHEGLSMKAQIPPD